MYLPSPEHAHWIQGLEPWGYPHWYPIISLWNTINIPWIEPYIDGLNPMTIETPQMVFLWFSHGFPMVFLWFSHGFPRVFPWFSYGFPMVWATPEGPSVRWRRLVALDPCDGCLLENLRWKKSRINGRRLHKKSIYFMYFSRVFLLGIARNVYLFIYIYICVYMYMYINRDLTKLNLSKIVAKPTINHPINIPTQRKPQLGLTTLL